MKRPKTLIIAFLVVSLVGVGVYALWERSPTDNSNLSSRPEPEAIIPKGWKIPTNQILETSNGETVFSAYPNFGLEQSKIYLIDNSNQAKVISQRDTLTYVTTPILNPSETAFVYFQVYPMQIWVYDLNKENTTLVFSESELGEDEKNLFNPAIGYFGQLLDIDWIDDQSLSFTNLASNNIETYSIDIESGVFTKISESQEETGLGISPINVPFESQREEAWSEDKLGACSEETIGSAGCAITSVSMVLQYFGEETNTKEINSYLRQNNDSGYIECALRWDIVPSLAQNQDIALKFIGFNTYDTERLDYELSLGNPVIIGYNQVNFTDVPHWVVVTGKDYGGNYLTNDPWTGEQKPISYFGDRFDHMVVYEKRT